MESFRFRIPEFESQSFFFFLAYLFVLRENLNFSCFTWRLFFLFGACSIRLQTNPKQTPCRCNADAEIHNLCKQEKEVGLTISLDQAKERASTEARVSLSGWWSETRQKRRNLNGLERKRVQLHDFEVRWACFVSRACILVKEDRDKGRTWASGDRSCVGNRLQLRCWHCQRDGGHVKLNESES